jgi:membrane protease YdiL (CAAX protease family)
VPDRVSKRRRLLLLAAGVAALVFVKLRGAWPPWVAFHRWLAAQGVPDAIRNLDAWLVLLAVPLLAALVLARGNGRDAAGRVGLLAPPGRALLLALLCTVPMFLSGLLTGASPRLSWSLLEGVALAPAGEELFFRGLLCALLVRSAGMRFWEAAVLGGVLFGASHLSWRSLPTPGSVIVLSITTAGGIWFAWLLRCWQWNLWVPIFLHASMNFAWMLFDVAPDAAGGFAANIGRGLTIAAATTVTLRPSWFRLPGQWIGPPPERDP